MCFLHLATCSFDVFFGDNIWIMNDVKIFNAAAKNEGDTSYAHERDCQWVRLVGHFLFEVLKLDMQEYFVLVV